MKTTKLKPESSLSKIKDIKSKPLTKTLPSMDGEDFLADTPKKGSVTKPNSKTLDGEKFLSTKEKKIKSFESFVNENYKDKLKKLDDKLEDLLDTEPENKEEEQEQKELIKEVEDEINQIKIDIAEHGGDEE
jgi:peptidoglycan hydrolase CwlO-like protein